MMAMIEIEKVSERYHTQRSLRQLLQCKPAREVFALDNVNFHVNEGEIFGLVGHNGAGKTTLIKVLSTLLIPSAGTARVGGFDVLKDAHQVRRLIGLVSSNERSFFWRLSGRQNLRFFARLYNVAGQAREHWIEQLLNALGLADVADRRFDAYSTGMRQRLSFARAMLSRPHVLFMDEPTKGLDPISANALVRLVQNSILQDYRPTIIITSHQLAELERLCSRFAILSHGKVLRCGSMNEMYQSVTLRTRYQVLLQDAKAAQLAHLQSGIPSLTAADQDDSQCLLAFDERGHDLDAILREVMHMGATVLRCSEQPVTLEDIFSQVMSSEVDK